MNNTFDDTLPKSLRIPQTRAGVKIDSDAVRAELSRWVGWYRKETTEAQTPKAQHSDAEYIAQKLSDLYDCFANPQGMSPDLRALVQENMRQLGLPAPDYAKLAMCVRNAGQKLAPVRTGPRNKGPRDNAIRSVFHALQRHSTPKMGVLEARSYAAELVEDALGVPCPSDSTELRKIVRGN